MGRPGLLVGLTFLVGALLGIGASSVFLDVEPGFVQESVQARLGNGPLAELVFAGLDDAVFEQSVAEIRARQFRNLTIATVIAVAGAVALGHVVGRTATSRVET
ncbi:MAG: hypothetical protein AAF081_11345 [Actinomycetota bacterium]